MANRTYRYLTAEPLYPFGYGLSYSTFRYRSLYVRPSVVHHTQTIEINVFVTNEGPYDGDEVGYTTPKSRLHIQGESNSNKLYKILSTDNIRISFVLDS